MRKLLVFFLFPILVASCKKEAESSLRGVWIEKSLRLDTLEFDNANFKLRSSAYWDLSQNPNFPINHSAIYRYQLDNDSIRLNSFYSSYSGLFAYKFKLNSSTDLIIGKFYSRTSLPAILEFEKIQ